MCFRRCLSLLPGYDFVPCGFVVVFHNGVAREMGNIASDEHVAVFAIAQSISDGGQYAIHRDITTMLALDAVDFPLHSAGVRAVHVGRGEQVIFADGVHLELFIGSLDESDGNRDAMLNFDCFEHVIILITDIDITAAP